MDIANACRPGQVADISGEVAAACKARERVRLRFFHVAITKRRKEAIFGRQLMVDTNIEGVLIVGQGGIRQVVVGRSGQVGSWIQRCDVQRGRIKVL